MDKSAIRRIYDLKGSSVNREVKDVNPKPSTTLKDTNFKNNCAQEPEVLISKQDRDKLLNQIAEDINFLRMIGVMDYSMLLGIEG